MNLIETSMERMVLTITISNPPANTLSQELLKELDIVLDEAEKNQHVRVILIHGKGRFFSAGADIKEFTTLKSQEEFEMLGLAGQKLFDRIESFPKPIIAAIHGAALGGGLELALACHLRLVSNEAKLGLPELQLGIIPGFGGTQRLPRLIGVTKAAEMMFTSEPILGKDAVQLGLANGAYEENELFTKAIELAEKIAVKSPHTLKGIIELLNYSKSGKFVEGMKRESELFGQMFMTEDGKEGVAAFIEKRKPNFTGN